MTQAVVFLIDGFEEIEALATVDILRRGAIEVQTVSLTTEKVVMGSRKIPVVADALFEELDFSSLEILIIPGGTVAFNEHEGLKQQLVTFAALGKPIAAICAAPMVLGGLGLLTGKKVTCYPGFETYLSGATIQKEAAVVVDDNIITGRGPGLAMEFALTLVEYLAGAKRRIQVAQGLLLD